MSTKKKTVTIEVIVGPMGPCLSINNTRVAGPKPWGGGKVMISWKANVSSLADALIKAEGGE